MDIPYLYSYAGTVLMGGAVTFMVAAAIEYVPEFYRSFREGRTQKKDTIYRNGN